MAVRFAQPRILGSDGAMRRAFAAAILGPSLLIASLAWSAFGLQNTMLDPDRSERVADALFDNPAVQRQLQKSIAGAVGAQLPDEVPISDSQLESGAGIALANPAVSELIRDAFVQAHQAFLGEAEPPTSINIGSVGDDVRNSTLDAVPGAAALLPESPDLIIDLPTDRIPNLGGFRRWLSRATPLLGLISVVGIAIALLTSNHRPSILRRAGFWAIGASLTWLALNIGVPWLAAQWFSGRSTVAAVLVDAMFGEMRTPSIVLACVGIATIGVSIMWPAVEEIVLARGNYDEPMRRQRVNDGPKPEPLYQAPPVQQTAGEPAIWAPPEATVAAPEMRPAKPEEPEVERKWVAGVGYVDTAPKPDGGEPTQWIAGSGYTEQDQSSSKL